MVKFITLILTGLIASCASCGEGIPFFSAIVFKVLGFKGCFTSTIRLSITSQATSLLDTILASGSISSYVFTCDSTNNTPTTIAAGQLVADLTIRQNNVISSIVLTFVVVLGA